MNQIVAPYIITIKKNHFRQKTNNFWPKDNKALISAHSGPHSAGFPNLWESNNKIFFHKKDKDGEKCYASELHNASSRYLDKLSWKKSELKVRTFLYFEIHSNTS